MLRHPASKYSPFPPVALPDRQWPSRTIDAAPIWLSTDLRDGNQALIEPMDGERKRRFFDLLVKIGLKQIEVAFPSASETDFGFVRQLIAERLIPDDVWIQVLTQSREDLIRRTFQSLGGAERAIVHLYNATAPVFRRIVFRQDQAEITALAVSGARLMRDLAEAQPETEWQFEYSPEVFCLTELDFAVRICDAVLDVWRPTPARKAILNLPATVESATPNVYADQIEWFCRHLERRDSVIVSVHTHNDRGTGLAATELALLAGAERVEGCLFGNGERTGNVDLVALALNLYTQGIDPKLDFSDLRSVVATVEHCNQMPVHPRHPYAGELVFTAFSGSHQDAIKKGFAARAGQNDERWEVPYLAIDPADIGSSYEAVIRVNSQSGKGGVAWVLEQDQGLKLPRRLQIAFSRIVQEIAERTGKELTAADIRRAFRETFGLDGGGRFELEGYRVQGADRPGGRHAFSGTVRVDGRPEAATGEGNGPISAAVDALRRAGWSDLDIVDYHEHALGTGAHTKAAAYVECRLGDGRTVFGVGVDADITTASIKAVLSAAGQG